MKTLPKTQPKQSTRANSASVSGGRVLSAQSGGVHRLVGAMIGLLTLLALGLMYFLRSGDQLGIFKTLP